MPLSLVPTLFTNCPSYTGTDTGTPYSTLELAQADADAINALDPSSTIMINGAMVENVAWPAYALEAYVITPN